jgi:5-(carboxyamino)imidazole ribonucleotide mutase
LQLLPAHFSRAIVTKATLHVLKCDVVRRLSARHALRLLQYATSKQGMAPVEQSLRISIIMGSQSDWKTMKHAADTLEELGVAYETRVISAHRTPDLMFAFAEQAAGRGLMAIIAGAGGAAHLPGMVAAKTVVPVLGVPVRSKALNGVDSLLSIAQMPAGIPVGTLAIGEAGAVNAALLAAAIVGNVDAEVRRALESYRNTRSEAVLSMPDPARTQA